MYLIGRICLFKLIILSIFFFRIDNCIFDEKSSKILAVLDWELSTLGDPFSDVAYSCLLHHLPQSFPVFAGKCQHVSRVSRLSYLG